MAKSQGGYVVGGAVAPDSTLYIPRQADTELLALCHQNAFAYLLAARQMGKSSLMFRTAHTLATDRTRPVLIDLNEIGVKLTAEQWYFGLLTKIKQELALQTDVFGWWQAHARLGVAQRLTLFFKEVLLAEIPEPVVIFVDEVDSTLSLDFSDDFFAAARYLYNARARVPDFKRLSFVLIGVATPADLIRDPSRTPFNIGQQIDLSDFSFQEAKPLAAGLNLPRGQALQLLGWVLNWTGGHPYLTQRLCHEVASRRQSHWSESELYRVVKAIFLGESRPDPNLQFVRDMVTRRSPDLAETMNLYRAIRSGLYAVPDEERSPIIAHLKLAGIVRQQNGVLHVRNDIYKKVFDLSWVEEVEAIEAVGDRREVRRLRALAEAQKRQAEEEKQRAEAERQRAEAERQRASEQTEAAARLRRRAIWLATALAAVLVAVIVAIGFGIAAQTAANQEATARAQEAIARIEADANLATAQIRATQEALARQQAVANLSTAEHRATLEAVARADADANLATAQNRATLEAIARGEAVANLSTAEYRATLEAEARTNAEAAATLEAMARADADTNLATAEHRATLESIAKEQADANLATAQVRATQEAEARQEADDNLATAEHRATQEAEARNTAEAEATRAFQEQQRAEAEATRAFQEQQRAEAEATRAFQEQQRAEEERDRANEQTQLAISRQLAEQARNLSDTRYGLALLLSLEANRIADTVEARSSAFDVLLSDTPRLATLTGHSLGVTSAAFSPDEQTLVSAGEDGTILWDISDRHNPQPLFKVAALLENVAFNSDGQLMASAGASQTLVLWDTPTQDGLQRRNQTASEHRSLISTIAFHPDDQLLASADFETIILWDIENPDAPVQLSKIDGLTMAFSPDRQTLATGDNNGTITLWDIRTPETPLPIGQVSTGLNAGIRTIVFSPNGQTMVSSDGDEIILWTAAKPQQLGQLPGRNPVFTAEQVLAFIDDDDAISLWDISIPNNPGQLGASFTGHVGGVSGFAFSPDGQTLVSLGQGSFGDPNIMLWDISNRYHWQQIGPPLTNHTEWVTGITFSRDKETMASSDSEGAILLWDVSNWDNPTLLGPPLLGHNDYIKTVVFSPDKETLASNDTNGTIILWDLSDRNNAGQLGQPLTLPNGFLSYPVFSRDGKILAASDNKGQVFLWDLSVRESPLQLNQPLALDTERPSRLAFSPTEPLLASTDENDIVLWDLSTPDSPKQHAAPLTGHGDSITGLVFSSDGSQLASAAGDRTVILWNMAGQQRLQTFSIPATDRGNNTGLAFHPAGQMVASDTFSFGPRVIIVWHANTGEALWQPTLVNNFANSDVGSLAFSQDSRVMAVGGRDGTLAFWDVTLAAWQNRACEIAGRNLTEAEIAQFIQVPELRPTKPTCRGLPVPASLPLGQSTPQIIPGPAPLAPATLTPSPLPTATASPVPSPPPIVTPTPEPTLTATVTPTITPSPPTPTPVPTFTATVTATPTPKPTLRLEIED